MALDQRYDTAQAEAAIQHLWVQQGTYNPENNQGPRFTIDTPPPTVSGALHIGHIFSYTQTDIIARYKRMQGYSVVYPFGFDDNGLATERFVEKKTGIRAHQVGRSAFIATCLEATQEAEEVFKQLWQRMGLSVNWNLEYSTIGTMARRISQAGFLDLYAKGFAYRTQEPALYCTECRTSVAQAELDDAELPSLFTEIFFTDAQGERLMIATTRPELLPACVAVMVHPDDTRYTHLVGTKVMVPLFGFTVPVITDGKVKIDKGTGAVMCCTFGDATDIEWYKAHQLPFKQAIGLDGKMTALAGQFAGLKVPEARVRILIELKQQNLVGGQKSISHAVGTHERCKKEIEYTVLPQWFITILEHKQKLLALADSIQWYPAFMKTRYINWVENLGWDWCISRQRMYGIPFPVWHCSECKAVLCADISQLPIDPQETAYGKPCPDCSSMLVVPDTDVMDTWNTSALTPYIVYELVTGKAVTFTNADKGVEGLLPMSMRPQAHDIIRTWAFYTIARAWMHHDTIPWHSIVISGHVLSDSKEKLSKSKGNAALVPEQLLNQYSADVIRYWTASGALGYDVAFSDNQLKIGQKLVTKLWNAFRFVETHIVGQQAGQKQPEFLGVVNEWILDAASKTYVQYQRALDTYEFGAALAAVERFFWADFCDNYLELIKDQLFKPERYNPELVAATRWTLHAVGLRILQLYAPYVPYVTESLYQSLYADSVGVPSLHRTRYVGAQTVYEYPSSVTAMETLLSLVSAVRKLKSEAALSLKTPIAVLTVASANESVITLVKSQQTVLAGVLSIEQFTYTNAPQQTALFAVTDTTWSATVQL